MPSGLRSKRSLVVAIALAAIAVAAALIIAWTPRENGPEITITVTGLVEDPITVNLANLKSRPSVTVNTELICVSGISSGTHNWTGVKLKDLLTDAGVQAGAIKVAFTASDYYTTDLNLSDAMRDDVLVAYLQDGSPFAEKTRLVVPGKWGYKWITDLVNIELVDYDFLGKWERRGYSDDAIIA